MFGRAEILQQLQGNAKKIFSSRTKEPESTAWGWAQAMGSICASKTLTLKNARIAAH